MRLVALVCAVASCLALSGCVVHSHHLHGAKIVVPGSVVVVPNTGNGCPPGQAKKGKC